MMVGYAARYEVEGFEALAVEKEFEAHIRNPDTGRRSQTFTMAGKADGVARAGGDVYLIEHKTASSLDGDYLDKLWTDTQIALYSFYLRQAGFPIVDVIYNALLKSRLQQKKGETEHEYHARLMELAAGTRTAVRTPGAKSQRATPSSRRGSATGIRGPRRCTGSASSCPKTAWRCSRTRSGRSPSSSLTPGAGASGC